MRQVQVAIVGGGLSGMYAAALLEQAGVDYLLIEGRDQAGGRIQSLHAADETQRFDLGATWVWPAFQTQLAQLLQQLDIELIAQEEQGDMLLDRALHQPISRHPGYVSTPRCQHPSPESGPIPALGWRRTPNTWQFTPDLFGGSKGCQGKHAAPSALWLRFTMPRRQSRLRHCSAFWEYRRKRAGPPAKAI